MSYARLNEIEAAIPKNFDAQPIAEQQTILNNALGAYDTYGKPVQKAIMRKALAGFNTYKAATNQAILRKSLEELVGTRINFANLSSDQLRQILLSLAVQLAPYYMGANKTSTAISNALDKTDVGYHTFLRLWHVFGNVVANGTNSDADHPDNSFNQAIANPDIAATLGAASVIPAVLGIWLDYMEVKRERERNTLTYNIAMAQKVNGDQSIIEDEADQTAEEVHQQRTDEDKALKSMQGFISRGKTNPTLKADAAAIELTDKAVGSNKVANFINRIVNSKPIAVISKVWGFLTTSALVFWPAWMISVLIVGFAASYALPVLPIVVAVSIVAAIAIKAGITYLRHREQKKEEALNKGRDKADVEAEKTAAEKEAVVETRMVSEISQRFNMKQEHGYFKQLFHVPKTKSEEDKIKAATLVNTPYAVTATKKDKLLVAINTNPEPVVVPKKEEEISFFAAIKKLFHRETAAEKRNRLQKEAQEKAKADAEKPAIEEHKKKVEAALNSKIGKHLYGSKAARYGQIAVTMTNDAIGYYTLSAFILWLAGSALMAIGLAPGAVAAAFGAAGSLVLGSVLPGISAAFNVVIGGLYSMKAFANSRNKQLAFEKDIYLRLSEEYTPNNTQLKSKILAHLRKAPTGSLSNQEAFDYYAEQVEEKKKRFPIEKLNQLKKDIKDKLKNGKNYKDLKPFEQYIHNFDLKNIDVYNDRYFRTRGVSTSTWTYIKSGAFKVYKAINAAQTWIFVTRSLFLVGAVLAGICLLFGPAAGIAFIAIAATMAVAGVALKLTQMHLDTKAAEKKFFVDTFPARISYLKKKDKQLTALIDKLNNPATTTDDSKHSDELPVISENTMHQRNISKKPTNAAVELTTRKDSKNNIGNTPKKSDKDNSKKDAVDADTVVVAIDSKPDTLALFSKLPETLPSSAKNTATLYNIHKATQQRYALEAAKEQPEQTSYVQQGMVASN